MKNKVVFIVGPTGVGKTDLAFKLAKKFDGELISVDSVQVYKKLNIISGKDIPKDTQFISLPELSKNGINAGYYNYNSIPIFLLDVVEPTFSFSVSQFHKLASKVIQYTGYRGNLPIIVGGTGLYVKSLIDGLDKLPEPDLELRRKLETLNVEDLQKKLKKLNPEKFKSMNDSDVQNKRRLIRAIEISKSKLPTTNYPEGASSAYQLPTNFDSLVIGLTCKREVLKERIDKRVEERLKNGALQEAEGLFKNYKNLSRQVKDANGYKQLFMFLNDMISFEEAVYRWKISEYRHAKNQMTWFQKYGNVKWFNIEEKEFDSKINESVQAFLKST